jgi:L-arabinose isomerase
MKKTKIGFLALYLKLYDDKLPELREKITEFKKSISNEFLNRDIDVVNYPICRIEREFKDAVKLFESENVDAIVTLHLAYSPSLESSAVLAGSKLPVIILDTTPDYDFAPGNDSSLIFANHGIHGVMDMCNLLNRNGKAFQIEAGHWKHSDVLDRVAKSAKTAKLMPQSLGGGVAETPDKVRGGCPVLTPTQERLSGYAAKLATFMRNIRMGLIGNPFDGMGDFLVPYDKLEESTGIEVVRANSAEVANFTSQITDEELEKEIINDRDLFIVNSDIDDTLLKNVNKAGLAIRKWIKHEKLSGFTVNFDEIQTNSGLTHVPFLEGSKSMMHGLGYAGEGDVLTASLVATLASEFPETSFVEIFCPGWKSDTLLLSHMGEMNLNLCAEKAELIKYDSDFVNQATLKGVGCFKPGNALLVNLAPLSDEKFRLILAPVEVLDITGKDKMRESVRGWIKPQIPITQFLEQYSKAGGTHHQAMVYNADIEEIAKFAEIMDWEVVRISDV